MAILSGPEIKAKIKEGLIHIDPFVSDNVGPNSVDLRLADEFLVYVHEDGQPITRRRPLDVTSKNHTNRIIIPTDGYILHPGILYLGCTIEEAGSDHYVPCIEGRSSMARLGISPHVSAGFGDHGFKTNWTLEITVVHEVRVYAGMRICQIVFHELIGDHQPYQGKYVNSTGIESSRSHEDHDIA